MRSVERLRTLTHRLSGRPGLAGWPGRLALGGRHIAELTHELGRVGRALVARRERRYHELRLVLETYDLRRQVGEVRTRLMRGDASLRAAAVRAHTLADGRFRGQAARLESLSPVAVLGRGYAVCWDRDRTRIIRDAETVREGDAVRVTLHRGELECTVNGVGSRQ
jgi:exodeoxyribonuclease VII large subunit